MPSLKHPRVLFLNHSDSNGGAALAALRLFNELNCIDMPVNMLVKEKSSSINSIITADNYKSDFNKLFEKYQRKIRNKIIKIKWAKYQKEEGEFFAHLGHININKALLQNDFDILHMHMIAHEFVDISMLKKINTPIIWTLHDCWPFTGICHYFYNCENYKKSCGTCRHLNSSSPTDLSNKIWKTKANAYKNLNLHIVSPSNWLSEKAKESTLFKNFPVYTIPNGIDTNVYKPLDKKEAQIHLGLNTEKKYILFGAINSLSDKRKGFYYLNEVLKNIKDQSIELLIFGTSDIGQTKINGLIAHKLGYIVSDEQKVNIFNAADVSIVPSLSENLSCVVMESLSCGTPVVAFNVGGNKDLIEQKVNGYLAEPFNTNELLNGIKWCMQMKNETHFRKEIFETTNNKFNIQKVAVKYHELYSSLFNK